MNFSAFHFHAYYDETRAPRGFLINPLYNVINCFLARIGFRDLITYRQASRRFYAVFLCELSNVSVGMKRGINSQIIDVEESRF